MTVLAQNYRRMAPFVWLNWDPPVLDYHFSTCSSHAGLQLNGDMHVCSAFLPSKFRTVCTICVKMSGKRKIKTTKNRPAAVGFVTQPLPATC
jgi:hypothetical protein